MEVSPFLSSPSKNKPLGLQHSCWILYVVGVRCVPDVLHLSFCIDKVFVSHSNYFSNKNFCWTSKVQQREMPKTTSSDSTSHGLQKFNKSQSYLSGSVSDFKRIINNWVSSYALHEIIPNNYLWLFVCWLLFSFSSENVLYPSDWWQCLHHWKNNYFGQFCIE